LNMRSVDDLTAVARIRDAAIERFGEAARMRFAFEHTRSGDEEEVAGTDAQVIDLEG